MYTAPQSQFDTPGSKCRRVSSQQYILLSKHSLYEKSRKVVLVFSALVFFFFLKKKHLHGSKWKVSKIQILVPVLEWLSTESRLIKSLTKTVCSPLLASLQLSTLPWLTVSPSLPPAAFWGAEDKDNLVQ